MDDTMNFDEKISKMSGEGTCPMFKSTWELHFAGAEACGAAGGGNRVKQRDTPPWQRPISSFFVPLALPGPCSPCGAPRKTVATARNGSDDGTSPSLACERWSSSDESMDVDMDVEANDAPQAASLPKPSKGKGRGKKTRDEVEDSDVGSSKRLRRDPRTPGEIQRPRTHDHM